jgi:hypothetical protein
MDRFVYSFFLGLRHYNSALSSKVGFFVRNVYYNSIPRLLLRTYFRLLRAYKLRGLYCLLGVLGYYCISWYSLRALVLLQ